MGREDHRGTTVIFSSARRPSFSWEQFIGWHKYVQVVPGTDGFGFYATKVPHTTHRVFQSRPAPGIPLFGVGSELSKFVYHTPCRRSVVPRDSAHFIPSRCSVGRITADSTFRLDWPTDPGYVKIAP